MSAAVKKLAKTTAQKGETGISQEVRYINAYIITLLAYFIPTVLQLQSQDNRLTTERKALEEASLQEKIVKEKQKYSDLLGKYEELQSSLSLGSEVQTELTKLQQTIEKVCISLEKVELIKKYWGDKVCL